MQLRLTVGLECAICGELRDSEQQTDDIATAALCGVASPYVQCPCCLQFAPLDVVDDPDYQRKVRVFLFEQRGHIVRIPAAPIPVPV